MELTKQEQETIQEWYGLYSAGWTARDLGVESFSHPAKISKSLSEALYSYALERGWLLPGDTVLDPFAGMGGTAKAALTHGLNWVGMELEPKFMDMAHGCECTGISQADWVRFYGRWDRMAYKAGRHWCPACVAAAQRISPPKPPQLSLFDLPEEPSAAYTRNSGRIPETKPHHYTGNLERFRRYARGNAWAVVLQGDSRYLRANLAAGFNGVVSSPPYANSLDSEKNGIDWEKVKKDYPGRQMHKDRVNLMNRHHNERRYSDGQSKNLGNLPPGSFDATIGSPPFAGNTGGQGEASRNGIDAALFDRHQGGMKRGTGDDPRNLDHLPMGNLDGVIGSPPYVDSVNQQGSANDTEARIERMKRAGVDVTNRANVGGPNGVNRQPQNYGQTDGQLGAMKEGDLDGLISSPPYANQPTKTNPVREDSWADGKARPVGASQRNSNGYGDDPTNLGNLPPGDLDGLISSPPYAQAQTGGTGIYDQLEETHRRKLTDRSRTAGYRADLQGDSDGQLGAMKEGDFDGVISSPVYSNVQVAKHSGGVDLAKNYETYRASGGGQSFEAYCQTQAKHSQGYGATPGQLAALPPGNLSAAIGSPPFAGSIGSDTPEKRGGLLASDPRRAGDRSLTGSYGETEGQLGAMAEGELGGVVSSPPFEDSLNNRPSEQVLNGSGGRMGVSCKSEDFYGSTPGQLGAESRETFWAAARQILTETFHLLKPGAVAIWVTKGFVRDYQIVDFPGQWRQLSEAVGFEFVEEIRAMQVSRPKYQRTIEGEIETIQRSSKSFFRRLFEKKYPDNRIDWETVVIMRKPF